MATNEKRAVRVNAAGALAVRVGGGMEPPPPPRDEEWARDTEGWRAGKPAEDPEKMKKWGLITARPSEFLIHMRRGRVREVSGQGASCFKLPGDSVAIVPTSVQRLRFTADQVTSEKVGVQVTGLAVYRIVEPLVAFRMLNFSFPERAQEKLRELLTEMFVGAVRRLVANLSVEECLTRRKEGIATELMREISPVVSGRGRPEDRTDTGWGVVLDTIEIQDVRVLSETVFANMQARFRQEQERVAREAELTKERFIRREEAEAERQIALTRLVTEEEVRHKRRAAEEQAQLESLAVEARVAEARVAQEHGARQAQVTLERETALAKLNAELEVREREARAEEARELARLETERRMAEARLENARALAAAQAQAELERLKLEAEAQAARHAAEVAKLRQEEERARTEAKAAEARCAIAEAELARTELEARQARIAQEPELARARAQRDIENTLSPESIQLELARQLPKVAAAFQQKMGEVHVTAVDGANPFGYIAAAVEGVMGLARSAGLQVPASKES
ncbi:hypothetical protein CYFUS_006833 [Cystobacter fuscus]|uniref:Band 7 domain-containing protein n=1 Tax=Cystobacter fuscus TaxID=43 RepID=A0A250JCR8_9BACT|nr:SPFH domain-containing protein [Cystobacter fuscus]ATB41368.1 hypothetical protein CYFUS_006833 [Cystobacter fuscus]